MQNRKEGSTKISMYKQAGLITLYIESLGNDHIQNNGIHKFIINKVHDYTGNPREINLNKAHDHMNNI